MGLKKKGVNKKNETEAKEGIEWYTLQNKLVKNKLTEK